MNGIHKGRSESIRDVLIPLGGVLIIFLAVGAYFALVQRDMIAFQHAIFFLVIPVSLILVVSALVFLRWNWSAFGSGVWAIGFVTLLFAFLPPEDLAWYQRLIIIVTSLSIMILGYLRRHKILFTLDKRRTVYSEANGKPLNSRGLETGPSAKGLIPPQWLKKGVTAVYLDSDGVRLHIHVVPQDNDFLVTTKIEDPEDLKELSKELFPDAEEEGYDEDTLDIWQQTQYGELFIDISKDSDTHIILGVPAQYAGTAEALFKGVSFSCIKLETSKVVDCGCADVRRRPFPHRGPGSCPRCGGILSSIRRCPRCGGSGKCPTCKGKGKFSATTHFWHEEKTGLLLKYENWRAGERVYVMKLEHLTPGISASDDRITSETT